MGDTESELTILYIQERILSSGNGTSTQTQNLQSTICRAYKTCCDGMAQNLWKWPTNDYSNLWPNTLERAQVWHSLDDQEPAQRPRTTGQKTKPNQNKSILVPGPIVISEASSSNRWEQSRDPQPNTRGSKGTQKKRGKKDWDCRS